MALKAANFRPLDPKFLLRGYKSVEDADFKLGRIDSVKAHNLDCRCMKQDASSGTELEEESADSDSPLHRAGSISSKTPQAPSAKASLMLLDQYAAVSENGKPFVVPSSQSLTIAEQLKNQFEEDEDIEEVTIPLGKKFKKPKLTISQKRNIRRQAYLTTVSKRNDSLFFLTIGLFVILPPTFILGIAIAIGYVDILP